MGVKIQIIVVFFLLSFLVVPLSQAKHGEIIIGAPCCEVYWNWNSNASVEQRIILLEQMNKFCPKGLSLNQIDEYCEDLYDGIAVTPDVGDIMSNNNSGDSDGVARYEEAPGLRDRPISELLKLLRSLFNL